MPLIECGIICYNSLSYSKYLLIYLFGFMNTFQELEHPVKLNINHAFFQV